MAQNLKIKAINDFLIEKTKETRDFRVYFDLVNGDVISADQHDILISNDEEYIKLRNAETDEACFLWYILYTDKIVGFYTSLDYQELSEDSDEDSEDSDIEFD